MNITKAMQAAQIIELRALVEQLRADLAAARSPAVASPDALGVQTDERGCYVRRSDYAKYADALAACRMAARVMNKSVRLV